MTVENIAQAHSAIKLEVDKSGSLENFNLEPEEIDYWLNKALVRWYKNRMTGVNPKKESVEQTQKRIDDLRVFIDEVTLPVSSGTDKPNSFEVTLPSNYWFTLGEEVLISYTDCDGTADTTKRQGITEVTSDTYQYELQNPYSDYKLYLYEAKPLRIFTGTTVQLITDSNYDITYYYLRYLKAPSKLSYYTNRITTGNIEENVVYKVLDGSVLYNTNTYTLGTTFTGADGNSVFSTVSGRGIVAEYVDFEVPYHVIDEIITIASNLILKSLGDPKVQLQETELIDME